MLGSAKRLMFASGARTRFLRSPVRAGPPFLVRTPLSHRPSFLVGSRIHTTTSIRGWSPFSSRPPIFFGHPRSPLVRQAQQITS